MLTIATLGVPPAALGAPRPARPVLADWFTLRTPPLRPGQIEVVTRSALPDAVTRGDVLVGVRGMAARDRLVVRRNRRDVTAVFGALQDGERRGLVSGLRAGRNLITAIVRGRRGRRVARLVVRNHPVTGPVISGPHQRPFYCQTETSGLGKPLDGDCSIRPRVQWFYRSRADVSFRELRDPTAPYPPDMIRTRTSSGRSVPFVVRLETRTINRGITRLAVLDDPRSARQVPLPLWNRRLDYVFGESCGPGYRQGESHPRLVLGAPAHQFRSDEIMSAVGGLDRRLGRGDLVVHSTQSAFGVLCNPLVSIETAMMVKEHVAEAYGEPEAVLGLGNSGGALQEYNALNGAPGLLDAGLSIGSFTDFVSTAMTVADCGLLTDYWARTRLAWTDEQKRAVAGHATTQICQDWRTSFLPNLDPVEGCDPVVPRQIRYHPVRNPRGVRCTVQDATVNIWGRDPATGFARRPLDNTGVQYGLGALNAGTISVQQFLDVNGDIGGYDIDARRMRERMAMDAGTARTAYRLGGVVGRGALDRAPLIALATYVDTVPGLDVHDHVRPFQLRERLRRRLGGGETMTIRNGFSLPGDAYPAMDRWLDAIRERGGFGDPRAIVAARPPGAEDRCIVGLGTTLDVPGGVTAPFAVAVPLAPGAGREELLRAPLHVTFPEQNEVASDRACAKAFPAKAEPRMVAGGPLSDDVIKCALKPVDPADYRVVLTGAELDQLRRIFPGGVCDWSRPGAGEVRRSMIWPSLGGPRLTRPRPMVWRVARSAAPRR